MKNVLRTLSASIVVLLNVAVTHAATIGTSQINGWPVITINGDLWGDDDAKTFIAIAERAPGRAIVDLQDVNMGRFTTMAEIGRYIHAHHYWTLVQNQYVCAGAGAAIWAAGERRFASQAQHIRFRPARRKKGELWEPSLSGSALLGAYYTSIGYSDNDILHLVPDTPDIEYTPADRDTPIKAELAVGFGTLIGIPQNPHPPAQSFFFTQPDVAGK